MDIKKIIGMGILCGLSFSGSAAQYPVVKYDAGSSYQGFGSGSFPLDCSFGQDVAQRIFGYVNKLVGDNPTDGALLSATALSVAWEIHNLFDANPEVRDTLEQAISGTLSPGGKQALLNTLKQQGAQILDFVEYFLEQLKKEK